MSLALKATAFYRSVLRIAQNESVSLFWRDTHYTQDAMDNFDYPDLDSQYIGAYRKYKEFDTLWMSPMDSRLTGPNLTNGPLA